ncbi:MAG: glycosyltransferase [Sphingobacteriales bacterium]|nr:MAG: glycosyltransferase [Sphingobacteriales bacterium]
MISIILPVFNCVHQFRNGIPKMIEVLRSTGFPYEIIVINDGSDDSQAIREISMVNGFTLIDNVSNLGKGASVKKGIFAASGDLIIFMDGDFPFNLTVINDMLRAFENVTTDIVIGDRSLPDSRYPKISLARRIGSRILSALVTRFILTGLADSQCGVKGFRRNTAKVIFERVKLTGFSFDVEVLFIARIRKYNLVRIPVEVTDQQNSSVRIVRDGLRMISGMIRIMVRYVVGKYSS